MTERQAIVGARLLDPASGLDAPGGVVIESERIVDVGPHLRAGMIEDAR